MAEGFSLCLEELGLQDLVKEADWKFRTGQKLKNAAGATKAHVSSWRHALTNEKRLDVLQKHQKGRVKGVKSLAEKHHSVKPGQPGRLDTGDAAYLDSVKSDAKGKLKDIKGKRAVDAGDWGIPKKKEPKKGKADSPWARRGKMALGVVGGAAAGAGGAYGVDNYLKTRKGAEGTTTKEMPTAKYRGDK